MTKMKKFLCAMMAMIMILAIIPAGVSAAEATGDPIAFEYDFNSEASLEGINAYHLPVTGYWDNMVGSEEDISAHWELTTVGDEKVIRRTNLEAGKNPGTDNNNAMLYLPGSYRYFEAEMSFFFGNSWGWAQLCFGAAQKGNHMHNNNAGVYMQQEGYTSLSCPGGNDFTNNQVTDGYTKAGLHTLKLRVEKGSADNKITITVWADGVQKIVKEDVFAENFSERSGYISLQAQNDNVSFNNIKITVLNEDGSVATQANKTALKDAIAAYEAFDASAYTTDSVAAYTAAIEAGKVVIANIYASQDDVDAAVSAINTAVAALEKTPVEDTPVDPEPQPVPNAFIYNFNSADDLSAFSAYYQPVMDYNLNKTGAPVDWTEYWELVTDAEGNTLLQRKNLAAGQSPSTGSHNSMLYMNAQKFTYFEAEMTFKFGDSWGWAQLCFGAAEKGNHMHHDNAGIYMQQEGYTNLSCPGGNDVEIRNVNDGYTKAGLHTVKLRVVKGSAANTFLVTVWADGVQKIEKEVYAENFSDRAGWISIQSQNDNIAIDSLKVTELDAAGNIVYIDNPATGDAFAPHIMLAVMAATCMAAAVIISKKNRFFA